MNVAKVVNDLVGYENLKIVQDTEYFNFSLESILLPRFCLLRKNNMKILDLCTGNAPIPLVMSTLTSSKIIGVELQKDVYELAKESVEINNLVDKIEILNSNVLDLTKMYETDSFDLITCNPPYFKCNEKSNLNSNKVKTIARHEIEITLEDVIKLSKKLLKNNSSLVMVHRTERLSEIIMLLNKHNMEIKRLRFIYPKNGENSNMILIDAKKNAKPGLKVLPPLVCHNLDGSYTKEVMKYFER